MSKQLIREIARQIRNTFCATGQGGGVDPTCSGEDRGLKGLLSGPMTREQSAKAKAIIDGAKTHAELKQLAKAAGVSSYVGKNAQETRRLLHQLVSKLAVSHQQTDF